MQFSQVYISRESLCAGDDVNAPNAVIVPVEKCATVRELVEMIWIRSEEIRNLRQLSKESWCLASAVPLAMIYGRCKTPHLLPSALYSCDVIKDIVVEGDTAKMHLSIFAPFEGEMVAKVLEQLRLVRPSTDQR